MFPELSRGSSHDVALTSHSSTTPTVREAWRTVPSVDGIKTADISNQKRNLNLDWTLKAINIGGMFYYLMLSSVFTLVAGFVTLPSIYTDAESLLHKKTILYFIYANMMLNYALTFICGRNFCRKSKKPLLPTQAQQFSHRFCERCQATVAARAKHCSVCDVCVFKRDHHCFFAGCCVGFFNQRYFVVFCIYASLGSVFCLVAISQYLRITFADMFSWEVYRYLLPWCFGEWIYGSLDPGIFALILLFYFTVPTCIGCIWFAGQQLVFIYRGQTTYEYLKGIKIYRTTPRDHFRSVFGSYWALNLLLPMPWIKPCGNGKDWNVLKHV